MKKIIFVNSLPIQYFAPLYKHLNERGIPTSCWYCSDENVMGHVDREFNSKVAWDIPLLEGYNYRFFRNHSWKPSAYHGFFGLINLGMISAFFKEEKSVVIVHGWGYFTNIIALVFASLAGHTVCLRGESPLNQEMLKSKSSRNLKKKIFRFLLFPFVNQFLFIGLQNKAFYQYYGVKEERLSFVPYAVDNQRFRSAAEELRPFKIKLREIAGLPMNTKMILFTAKFIQKKRPLDLLAAFEKLNRKDVFLVMVGDGELKPLMERFVQEKSLRNVYLPGFINQSEIVKYYTMADVFVMCSQEGETWGLSVNEAMNFDLPLIISDLTGCSSDLVQHGINGLITKTGDVDDLKNQLATVLSWKQRDRITSKRLLNTYSYDRIAFELMQLAENKS